MLILIRLLYAQLGIDHTCACGHVPKVTMHRTFDPNVGARRSPARPPATRLAPKLP